ncbi:hypothetical protein Pmani_038115 [Petrolisthes manimaculis]|uniref:Ig-like domain-containing protein n=1 Tax=Petrolisthes manimaculis TaxID=1843537 RepID=A0AAE1NHR3_9EUCA|nr:hypothetical protein Pmani_038115 [Petrolisthes manimaculis]
MSDQRRVELSSVSLQSSGKYRCEVSADEPSFHTESKSDEMLVVVKPDKDPSITGGQTKYHAGDQVNVNCTSERSRPAASLEWYINGEKVKTESDKLLQYTPVNDSDGLETSRMGLRFTARPQHFPDGHLHLKCTATIAAVYHMVTEEKVEGQLPQTGPALESKGVYSGGSILLPHTTWVSCLMLTLLAPHTPHLLTHL